MRRVVIGLMSLAFAARLCATSIDPDFSEEVYVKNFGAPTAMAFAPDGRLFICEQAGSLRVVQGRTLLAQPFLTVDTDSNGERGLLGVAFDPNFATNHFVYVYYTAKTPTAHNRVSRFTADGNTAVPGSELVILELDELSTATNHNGGALHFGNDGRLYVAVGDNATGTRSQSLANRFGKILRINRDGSIPADNPFYSVATGPNRAIWALGLRNPFTLAIQSSTGRMFINDVGQDTWEEINEGIAGANYGWPLEEGPPDGAPNPDFTYPLYAYEHVSTGPCAITGGAFYEAVPGGFPAKHVGDYFFGDFCSKTISKFDVPTDDVSAFSIDIRRPVDIREGPDGALYYLSRNPTSPRVIRVRYAGETAPRITQQPASVTLLVGQAVTFTVIASGLSPLHYQWRRDGVAIAGETSASYRFTSAKLSDSGAAFDVVVTNTLGTATSNAAVLTVTTNTRPTASITQPLGGTRYKGGDVIQFAGNGNDAEDGVLPASAFTWWVDLHHDTHTHPQVLPFPGAKSGSFAIPVSGETSDNVFYRIHLQVVDSGGLTRSLTRDVQPLKTTITLASDPSGLELRLDGQPIVTPYTFTGVVGIERSLEAVTPQTVGGSAVEFVSWSDNGARAHVISTPSGATTYTAVFAAGGSRLTINDPSVIEGDSGTRNGVFTIKLSRASTSPVSVKWATADGSAIAGADYVAASGTVTFAAGTTSRTVAVPVIGDTTNEPDETFDVVLSAPVGAALGDARGTATINSDDGGGTVRFNPGLYPRKENLGPVVLTVVRPSSIGAASVKYATSAGTATAGGDFQSTSGTLDFADGASTATLSVPLVADSVIETDETFTVTLSEPTNGLALGSPATATVTIQNDDQPGIFAFGAANYIKSEAGPSATITVQRSGGTASGIAVSYATANGTASAGADYDSQSGTLTFGAGVTSMTFTIPIVNDTLDEADETVNLSLSNPTAGATLGTRPNAMLTITDNDSAGIFVFGAATYSRAENGGTATVSVKRSGGTASGATVQYATGGGTATAGVDYTPISGTLTFAAGQTTAQLTIALTADTTAEADETIGVTLSSPGGGATLGTPSATTLTIVDDD
jgi:glucose/arabinose dehydrogenase